MSWLEDFVGVVVWVVRVVVVLLAVAFIVGVGLYLGRAVVYASG